MNQVDLCRVRPDQVLLQRSASTESAHWRLSSTHVLQEQPTVSLFSNFCSSSWIWGVMRWASSYALLATSNTELAGFKPGLPA
jgi:hypothetical protein